MVDVLGHTPPPRSRLFGEPLSPFDRYAGMPFDRELAIALDKFRESADADADDDDAEDAGRSPLEIQSLADSGSRRAAAAADGPEKNLRYWQSDVRRLLVLNELTPLLRVATLDQPARLCLVLRVSGGERDIAVLRIPPLELLCRQLPRVVKAAKLREARRQEILSQVDAVDVFFGAVLGMHPEQHPLTIELLDVVSRAVAVPIQQMKHLSDAARPAELSPDVQPMIMAPGHASFPGGHAAYAHAIAVVLAVLVNRDDAVLQRLLKLALRIGRNRVIAGLHYPYDTRAGRTVGLILGLVISCMAMPESCLRAFRRLELDDAGGGIDVAGLKALLKEIQGGKLEWSPTPNLRWLWAQAATEWRNRSCATCVAPAAGEDTTSAAP